MIKVKLTENYGGFYIEGTYDDFNELYDSIYEIIGGEELANIIEEDMRLHILGFQYDLRHAYQGSRNIIAIPNNLSDDQKECFGIKKSVREDVLYGFNYLVTDLILDIILIKNFIKKNPSVPNGFNTSYNVVTTFYSKVVDSLGAILTEVQLKKLKKLLITSSIGPTGYLRQWFTRININYINMSKTKRKKEIIHVLKKICEWYNYDEYDYIKKIVYQYASEHKYVVTDIEIDDYPDNIVW